MSDADDRDHSRERERRRDRPSRFSENKRERSPDRGKDRGGMKSSNCRVYVSNIPYEFRWQDLKDLFRSHVGDVVFVELFVDENDKPRGCGIVEFSDPESVKKCLEVMHRFELKGRKIVIKEDFGNQRDKYGNLIGSGAKRMRDRDDGRDRRDDRRNFDMNSGVGGGGAGRVVSLGGGGGGGGNVDNSKWGYTYGLSPQFLESLNIHQPLTTRVFVANLDYKVTKKKLKEVFRLAGKVQYVDLSVDKDGKSRGFAVVEYDHPVESVQAISMFHNQELHDRMMTVRMDRAADSMPKLPDGLKSVGMGLGPNGEPMRDVARTVPSMNNNSSGANSNVNSMQQQQQQQQVVASNSGPGLLGAVPALQSAAGLMNASALSNLSNSVTSALGNLNTNAVLQAANLAAAGGLSQNLLSGTLGAGDLNLAANLVSNPLVQGHHQSLAALANNYSTQSSAPSSGYQGGGGGGGGQSNNMVSQNSYGGGGGGMNSNGTRGSGGGGGGHGYDGGRYDSKGSSFNFGGGGGNAGGGGGVGGGGIGIGRGGNFGGGHLGNDSGGGGGGGMMRPPQPIGKGSTKIIIANLPPTANYKVISDKCQDFGNVQRIEDKGDGSVVVSFANEWDAERAMKNMDRARIDGRTIDVRFYY